MWDQKALQNEEVQRPEFAYLDVCGLQKEGLSQHRLDGGLNTITDNAAVNACEKGCHWDGAVENAYCLGEAMRRPVPTPV